MNSKATPEWHTLIELFDLSRSIAYRMATDIDEADFDEVQGDGHCPTWILGHLCVGMEEAMSILGQPTPQLDAMMPLYGPGSSGGPMVDAGWTKEKLLHQLQSSGDQLRQYLHDIDPNLLSAPNKTPFHPNDLPTMGGLLAHIITTHVALHAGQLSQWRRCRGMDSLFQLG